MKKVSWGFVLAGFGSLLVSAFYDNMRGPLMPPVAAALGLSFSDSGWFLAIGSAAGIVATLVLMRALNIWSERSVMIVLAGIGILTGAMAPFVSGRTSLMVLAAFIGMTISTIGTMANVLIVEGSPPENSGRFLSALHAMFGVGATLAVAGVGIGIARGLAWSSFYLAGIPFFAALGIFAALRLKRDDHRGPVTIQSSRPSPTHVWVIAAFSFYVAGEVTAAAWMTSYLVGAQGLTVASAAPYLAGFFLAMAISRILCAVLVTPANEAMILRVCLLLPIVFFGVGFAGSPWAFSLVGLFGPFFPLFLARASRAFPETWRSMTIWTIVVMNLLLGTFHITLGGIADRLGIRLAYCLPAGLLVGAFVLLNICLIQLGKHPNSIKALKNAD